MIKQLLSVHNRPKLIAFSLWVLILIAYRWYVTAQELTPLAIIRQLIELLQGNYLGPLVFIIFYILQPLVFFPSWLLTILAGFLYGPVLGVIYTVIASNLSSMVAYLTGTYFGKGLLESTFSENVIQRYAHQMRENSFETVLVMRFLFLPYDLVSYLAGFLRIRWKPFLLATVLGSLPGSIAFVLFGASIQGDFQGNKMSLNPWVLGASISMFIASIVMWRYFKSRGKAEIDQLGTE